jgi:hypothetical protein
VKEAAEVLVKTTKSKPTGRKPKHGVSTTKIAEALGVSQSSVVQAEQHVETAEEFPFMQRDDWRRARRP